MIRRRFQHMFNEDRQPFGVNTQLLRQYTDFVLGCGNLGFVGANSIYSIVRISDDPNDRGNPRGIVLSHKDKIRRSIDQDKHDWEKPVMASVDPSLIDDAMKTRLKQVHPFTPGSAPYFLRLNNMTEEEQTILYELTWERVKDAPSHVFLTAEEIEARKTRLDELRLNRPMCKLLNGNHRIHACIDRAKDMYEPLRQNLISLMRRFWADGDKSVRVEMEYAAKELEKMAHQHTWQVLVVAGTYSCLMIITCSLNSCIDNAPPQLKHALMRNYESDPQMGEDVAEANWMTAIAFEASLARWRERCPNETRAEIMDRAHLDRVANAKGKGAQDDSVEVNGATKGGTENWVRALNEPFLLEMVLDTRVSRFSYVTALPQRPTVAMCQPASGAMGGRFWLAVRTLIKVSVPQPRRKAYSNKHLAGELLQRWRHGSSSGVHRR